MGKKPSKDTDEKKEPWEKEAEELGVTGEPDPWEAELPKVVGPAKPASTVDTVQQSGPVPPVGSNQALKPIQPVKPETQSAKTESNSKSITKVPGPKRKFQ